MHNIPSNLKQDIIDGKRAVLVKITQASGTVYGYTDHDLPLTVGGQLYVPAPGIKRITLTSTTSDSVSNQEFAAGWVDAPEQDLLSGKFDNAIVETMICSWENPSYGSFTVDKGNLGVIQWTADGFRGDVQSHMRQLTRNIIFQYTAGCCHTLFDSFTNYKIGACTLNGSSWTHAGAVSTVTTPNLIFTTALSLTDNYATNGVVVWTSGANTGHTSPIKKQTSAGGTTIELYLPTPDVIAPTDNFEIKAGCDKTLATCKSKFNNVINFGGFPHIQVEVTTR